MSFTCRWQPPRRSRSIPRAARCRATRADREQALLQPTAEPTTGAQAAARAALRRPRSGPYCVNHTATVWRSVVEKVGERPVAEQGCPFPWRTRERTINLRANWRSVNGHGHRVEGPQPGRHDSSWSPPDGFGSKSSVRGSTFLHGPRRLSPHVGHRITSTGQPPVPGLRRFARRGPVGVAPERVDLLKRG